MSSQYASWVGDYRLEGKFANELEGLWQELPVDQTNHNRTIPGIRRSLRMIQKTHAHLIHCHLAIP
jgi:hypothetical protein